MNGKKVEEKVEGKTPQPKASAKTVSEEIQAFQEKKAQLKKENPTTKTSKGPKTIDMSSLETFKSKAIKEFGLTEKMDKNGCYGLYFKDMIVLKLLPRKNCLFGVWRESSFLSDKSNVLGQMLKYLMMFGYMLRKSK